MSLSALTNGQPLPKVLVEDFGVSEVLYEAEAPIVFTARTALGQPLLAYLAEEAPDGAWLFLAPASARLTNALFAGRIGVREALTGSWLWLARRNVAGQLESAWAVDPKAVPEGYLPAPNTPLFPEHDPVFTTRAVGEGIVPGAVPSSVVAYVADATRRAFKALLDHVLERTAEGRPPEQMRALYDLPVNRFVFASFAIDYGAPPSLFENKDVARAASLLQKGIAWAASTSDVPLDAESDDERGAVLRAVLPLTPPSTGPIQCIEVGGRWMPRGTTRLTRTSRRRVHAEIRRLQSESVVRKEGRIGEMDKDNLTFILRDTDQGDIRSLFAEELLDDVLDFFTEDRRVVVAGVERAGKLYVAAVALAETVTGAEVEVEPGGRTPPK